MSVEHSATLVAEVTVIFQHPKKQGENEWFNIFTWLAPWDLLGYWELFQSGASLNFNSSSFLEPPLWVLLKGIWVTGIDGIYWVHFGLDFHIMVLRLQSEALFPLFPLKKIESIDFSYLLLTYMPKKRFFLHLS